MMTVVGFVMFMVFLWFSYYLYKIILCKKTTLDCLYEIREDIEKLKKHVYDLQNEYDRLFLEFYDEEEGKLIKKDD